MDARGRLLVGAATHTKEGARGAIKLLADAGVDVLVIVSLFGFYSFYYRVFLTIVVGYGSHDFYITQFHTNFGIKIENQLRKLNRTITKTSIIMG